MTQQEINACVGKTFQIRGARHLCIAAGNDALMLLQLCEKDAPLFKSGDPVQYVVARRPEWYNGELIWAQGEYFPLLQYHGSNTSSSDALRDASLTLNDNALYVAMADDDLGARCEGVFTRRIHAENALEQLINRDEEVLKFAREYEKTRFSFAEYQTLYCERSLDNCYWIEERSPNRIDQ